MIALLLLLALVFIKKNFEQCLDVPFGNLSNNIYFFSFFRTYFNIVIIIMIIKISSWASCRIKTETLSTIY